MATAYDNWKTSDPSLEPPEPPCNRCRARFEEHDECEKMIKFRKMMKEEE